MRFARTPPQEHGTGGFKRMYAGDGWAGQKVPGQSQDYTNTVQTERLRETLRKEQVRGPLTPTDWLV